jgi:hypothetical protein
MADSDPRRNPVAGVEKTDFPRRREGYDPVAVNAHLRALAELLEAERAEPSARTMRADEAWAIISAAEASAAEIKREAERDAEATAEEAARHADAVRLEAKRRADEYVKRMGEVTASMLARLGTMEARLGTLAGSVPSTGERLPEARAPTRESSEPAAIAEPRVARRPLPKLAVALAALCLLGVVVVLAPIPADTRVFMVLPLALLAPGLGMTRMIPLRDPWLEATIAFPLSGALCVLVAESSRALGLWSPTAGLALLLAASGALLLRSEAER